MLGTMTITPHLWFDGDIEAAATLYTSAFRDATVTGTSRYPTENLPDFQAHLAGEPLTVDLDIAGQPFTLLNGGPAFRPNPSISFMVSLDPSRDPQAREHLDDLWSALSDGGEVLMDLGTHPFSERYGWVQDRHHVSWQLILTNPDDGPRPYVQPSLLFSGPVQDRATEAIAYYTSVFPRSDVGVQSAYADDHGAAAAGALAFGELMLDGQWFAAMDSGVEREETFTEGVSLMVACRDQEEIDRYWAALSAVPDSEQSGWCKDRFGVSWQVVPRDMAALLSRPGAFQSFMSMRKIVIADL